MGVSLKHSFQSIILDLSIKQIQILDDQALQEECKIFNRIVSSPIEQNEKQLKLEVCINSKQKREPSTQ